jgi:hypothetical protein
MSQKEGDLQFTDELPATNDSLCVNLVANFNQNRFGHPIHFLKIL